MEIWGAMPALYLLIIFSALFSPSVGLLVVLISAFGWLGIAAYVRAEFLKNRTLDYVRAAKALGQRNRVIIFRHILPNSLTPVITLIPFEMAGAIGALTSLDFLGLGVPPGTPSLGELLAQGKNNLDAWWISLATVPGPGDHPGAAHPGGGRPAGRPGSAERDRGGGAMSLLEVQELSIRFGARRVVDRVSFRIEAGEKLALVGESGSGKTVTALSTLRLLDAARLEGSIRFEGPRGARHEPGGAPGPAGQRDRRHLPGAHDRPEPGHDRRRPDRGGAPPAPGHDPVPGPGAGHRGPAPGGGHRA